MASFWIPSGQHLGLWAPELIVCATIVALLAVPIFIGRRRFGPAIISLAGVTAAILATSAIAAKVAQQGLGGMAPPGEPSILMADRFTVFFKLFLLGLLILIIWLWSIGAGSRRTSLGLDHSGRPGSPEFFVLLLTSALGMMLMVGTSNLLVMIIAIETASVPSYAMVASDKRSRLAAEASLKYVMYGAATTAIMAYGASLLYGRCGSLDIPTIAASAVASSGHVDPVFWLGLAGIAAGIAFKIAAVPMHFWCPDVFEGAPIEVTTWLSIASKAAGLGLLLRIVDMFSAGVGLTWAMAPLAWTIGGLAAVTCTVGNLAALRQQSVKRILAYSSIAHAGYMMMAATVLVGPKDDPNVNAAMSSLIAYLVVYVVMNVGAFGVTALVAWQAGTDHVSAFTGLGRRAPWLAVPLAVCLFSLVGLPPLGGFAAKWYLLIVLGRAAAHQHWLWVLVFVAVINTAISLYYYVWIVRQMFLTDDESRPAVSAPPAGLLLVNACAAAILLLGTLYFSPLGSRANLLASNLFHPASASHVARPTHPAPVSPEMARR